MSSPRIHGYWLIALTVLTEAPAGADVYSFVDDDGVVHFTNVPTDSRFRRVGNEGGRAPRRAPARKNQPQRVIVPPGISKFDDHVGEAAKRFNIPEALVRAVMIVESNLNPEAVSSAGAQGLMQLMPRTGQEMGVEDPFDPRQNVLGGTRYLRTLANVFDGDLVLTLAAYNAGHQAVFRHMDIPPFAETQQYVRRVLQLYFQFKRQAKTSSDSSSKGRDAQ